MLRVKICSNAADDEQRKELEANNNRRVAVIEDSLVMDSNGQLNIAGVLIKAKVTCKHFRLKNTAFFQVCRCWSTRQFTWQIDHDYTSMMVICFLNRRVPSTSLGHNSLSMVTALPHTERY